MPGFQPLFPTQLYSARLTGPRGLAQTCLAIAAEDKAGRRWARAHGYGGYTSYASLNDLTRRASVRAPARMLPLTDAARELAVGS